MKRTVVLSVCLFVALALAGPTYLVKVDLAPGQTGRDLHDAGLKVLHERDGYCLVLATGEELARDGRPHRILAEQPGGRLFLLVSPKPGQKVPDLSPYGEVLLHDRQGALLATEESRMEDINHLPVELARVGTDPWIYRDETPLAPPHELADSLVWQLVNNVSEDSVLAHIRRLQNFRTRYSTRESTYRAVEWVETKFQAYNCDSTGLEPWRSGYAPNVIGVKQGKVNPNPIYVICGHADATVQSGGYDFCPGSDDNASGTAAVIEAARAFADVEFANTVYFLGFTGEEQGLWGSDSFTARASRRGDSIKAALNFDMISYGRENRDSIDVIGKTSSPNCAPLADAFRANGDTFAGLKTRRSLSSTVQANSDHYSFIKRGYPAIMGIERDFTPAYHTTGDTIGTLYYRYCGTNNVPLATKTVKAAVATIAKLAGAYIPTGAAEPRERTLPVAFESVRPSVGAAPIKMNLSGLPRAGATVTVFDAAGRPVTTIRPVGKEASWDGRSASGAEVPAGVYLFQLYDQGRTASAKAILTR